MARREGGGLSNLVGLSQGNGRCRGEGNNHPKNKGGGLARYTKRGVTVRKNRGMIPTAAYHPGGKMDLAPAGDHNFLLDKDEPGLGHPSSISRAIPSPSRS